MDVGKISKTDQDCQVNFPSSDVEQTATFICNRYLNMTKYCDAEVQTELSETRDEEVQCDSSSANSEDSVEQDQDRQGFRGFDSIKTDEDSKEMAGVTLDTFKFLLKIIENSPQVCTITKEQRLFICLMKMKTGLPFGALGVFFGLDEAAISEIFFSTLQYLSAATVNLVFWPSKTAVQQTMPECFKPQYSNARVIIDCVEFKTDTPSTMDNRILRYSFDEKCYTAKVLIGITPSGFICFKSKAAGGKMSDHQIVTDSNLIDLLEDGDVILADKRFSKIQSNIDASGKRVSLVTPPFLEKTLEVLKEETDKANGIAIVIERLKMYQIFDEISKDLFCYIDDIIHLACVLVNLQSPIYSD